MRERVMVIGKGAREDALAFRLARDSSGQVAREVLVSPGNDATAFRVPCMKHDLSVSGFKGTIELAHKIAPNLIVIGPEEPLSQGLSDVLRAEGFAVFGPSQKATQIESSKSFMKGLAQASGIPTAAFETFESEALALEYIRSASYPIVIKADGLCAGKGVVIARQMQEAKEAIISHISQGPILIESFLCGLEMSVIALCTEDDALLFAPVRDHKRLLNGDVGPNTGGMGVVGPLPEASSPAFMDRLREEIFLPALAHMRKIGCPFRGALFAGLMVDNGEIKLLEFNARFGDPETQALMYGTSVDIYPILLAIAKGEGISQFAKNTLTGMKPTAAITMAARGYPESPIRGDIVKVGEVAPEQGIVFFAGVSRNANGQIITEGGRVLTCTASDETLMMAIRKSYDIVSNISFSGAQYRTDIGRTLV